LYDWRSRTAEKEKAAEDSKGENGEAKKAPIYMKDVELPPGISLRDAHYPSEGFDGDDDPDYEQMTAGDRDWDSLFEVICACVVLLCVVPVSYGVWLLC